MGFIQIIEYKTTRLDELNVALDAWLERTKGKRAATRGTQTRDRDAENTYLQIVEFPTYEDAMIVDVTPAAMPDTASRRWPIASNGGAARSGVAASVT